MSTGGEVIVVKWGDVNQGDALDTNYRSRLAGCELNIGRDDALYASTLPLEALRLIVSYAAAQPLDGQRRTIRMNDVRRAYFFISRSRGMFTSNSPRKTQTPERGC